MYRYKSTVSIVCGFFSSVPTLAHYSTASRAISHLFEVCWMITCNVDAVGDGVLSGLVLGWSVL